MDLKTVENYIQSYEKVSKSYPYDSKLAVYSVLTSYDSEPQMFALLEESKNPLRISLRCDYKLSVLLRERYETVMPGNHLNQKIWNTIVLTGQLPWDEIQDLIRLSYNITAEQTS
jgi:predicted DNA-binding protein (MmcQ/YjbR family)